MLLSTEDMQALFNKFEHSAFRMELQQTYVIPHEGSGFRLWLDGREKPEGHNSGWTDMVSRHTDNGKTMQRLKAVRRPFSDYTRFLFDWAIPANVAAGEDYRILDITDRDLDIPWQDFWLFDESTVVLLNFESDGTLRDRELVERDAEPYLKWRDLALSEAAPFGEYRT